MITKINPEDQFGQHMTAHFKSIGLNTEHVLTCTDAPTGAASITVELDGKNSISVCMGANSLITEQDIEDARQTIQDGSALARAWFIFILQRRQFCTCSYSLHFSGGFRLKNPFAHSQGFDLSAGNTTRGQSVCNEGNACLIFWIGKSDNAECQTASYPSSKFLNACVLDCKGGGHHHAA